MMAAISCLALLARAQFSDFYYHSKDYRWAGNIPAFETQCWADIQANFKKAGIYKYTYGENMLQLSIIVRKENLSAAAVIIEKTAKAEDVDFDTLYRKSPQKVVKLKDLYGQYGDWVEPSDRIVLPKHFDRFLKYERDLEIDFDRLMLARLAAGIHFR